MTASLEDLEDFEGGALSEFIPAAQVAELCAAGWGKTCAVALVARRERLSPSTVWRRCADYDLQRIATDESILSGLRNASPAHRSDLLRRIADEFGE